MRTSILTVAVKMAAMRIYNVVIGVHLPTNIRPIAVNSCIGNKLTLPG